MREIRPSITRKGLMWWFSPPANPYLTLSGIVDFAPARAYLEQLNLGRTLRVSVHHLLVAAVARTIRGFPEANARIVGHRIMALDDVGVAMPVNLIGHAGGTRQETTMALVAAADRRTLVEIAHTARAGVAAERSGATQNRLVRRLTRFIERTPYPLLAPVFDLFDLAMRNPLLARRVYRQLPVSTAVTNVGSNFGRSLGPDGDGLLLFRGGAIAPPNRLLHVGTAFGIAPVQDEVVAVAGEPQVRPMLPIMMVFDHRLFDGVIAGRILLHLCRMLRDPEAEFGADGDRAPG